MGTNKKFLQENVAIGALKRHYRAPKTGQSRLQKKFAEKRRYRALKCHYRA